MFLDLIVLSVLSEVEASGYDLIRHIYDKFGVLCSPGTVYPMLSRLEKMGLIQTVSEGRRKVYRVTDKGRNRIDLLLDVYGEIYSLLRV